MIILNLPPFSIHENREPLPERIPTQPGFEPGLRAGTCAGAAVCAAALGAAIAADMSLADDGLTIATRCGTAAMVVWGFAVAFGDRGKTDGWVQGLAATTVAACAGVALMATIVS